MIRKELCLNKLDDFRGCIVTLIVRKVITERMLVQLLLQLIPIAQNQHDWYVLKLETVDNFFEELQISVHPIHLLSVDFIDFFVGRQAGHKYDGSHCVVIQHRQDFVSAHLMHDVTYNFDLKNNVLYTEFDQAVSSISQFQHVIMNPGCIFRCWGVIAIASHEPELLHKMRPRIGITAVGLFLFENRHNGWIVPQRDHVCGHD
mmetsp:Transcript_4126/g.6390  ORF Transcript_4126/g.6390 Transcript_4126/m.6390 type:complete len:203 (-) Transcript_4126:116-724(-)